MEVPLYPSTHCVKFKNYSLSLSGIVPSPMATCWRHAMAPPALSQRDNTTTSTTGPPEMLKRRCLENVLLLPRPRTSLPDHSHVAARCREETRPLPDYTLFLFMCSKWIFLCLSLMLNFFSSFQKHHVQNHSLFFVCFLCMYLCCVVWEIYFRVSVIIVANLIYFLSIFVVVVDCVVTHNMK